jgi:fructoselysine 6-kinase
MNPAIVCIGDSCVDHYEALGQKFPGGNPVNFAVYLRRLGVASSFVGAVGSDADGAMVLHALEEKGVDVSHVQILEGATPTTTVVMEHGNRVFTSYETGIMESYQLRPKDLEFIGKHAMAVSDLWGKCEDRLGEIRALGIPVAFDCADLPDDPAAQRAIPNTDIAFFSNDEASCETVMEKMKEIFAKGPSIVVAMRGPKGSMAYDGERFYSEPAFDCPVVDTLGAGDSFIAGFLDATLRKLSIQERMYAGSACSAVTIGYVGAW